MQTILEAEIEVDGRVRLLKPVRLRRRGRATVRIEDSDLLIEKTMTEDEERLAEERFARHFGSVASGDPNSADNEKIDADLVREYANAHDEE